MALALGPGLGLAASADAASVVLTPATPAAGGVAALSGSGFARHGRVVVRLGSLRARSVRADAHGRLALRLHVSTRASSGRRTLVVAAGSRTVRTTVRVVRGTPASSSLAALSGGQRFVLSAVRAAAGSRLGLQGTGLRARARLSVALAGAALGSARTSTRGRWGLAAPVPAVGEGLHQLTVRGSRVRLAVRFTVLSAAAGPASSPAPAPAPAPSLPTVTVAAAGDIACSPADPDFQGGAGTSVTCRQAATANLLGALAPTAVLPLGDTQYENGERANYAQSYGPSWGRFDAIAHPVPGDHEYQTAGATGYFAYFGARAGNPALGYYSFDLGAWHLVALNSNCAQVACAAGSAQEQWLRADLAAHPAQCTLAYWHSPRFSSGPAGQATATDPFWRALYEAGAEVVLDGHNHQYERFAPQTPDRAADPGGGIRQFVVGTGGEEHQAFVTVRPNSEVRNADTFGVLSLTLRPGGYDWRFVPEAGRTFTDAGSGACH
jgi:hypothetical protein